MAECFLVNVCSDHVCRYVCGSASEFGIVFSAWMDSAIKSVYISYSIYSYHLSHTPQISFVVSFHEPYL